QITPLVSTPIQGHHNSPKEASRISTTFRAANLYMILNQLPLSMIKPVWNVTAKFCGCHLELDHRILASESSTSPFAT
ncbi:Hypothetical protein CINCED_3A011764, partial [Cinara cedri]